jgi:phage shock protein PspC (stress-responsive transcriptional regulator)
VRAALAVRFGLPATLVAVGFVLTALGGDEVVVGAGVALTGVGMLVALLNVLMRLGIESGADREREEEARRYFDRHGRWPGER